MERWSYKPEVEGLSPSLGTKRKDEGGRMKSKRKGKGHETFAFYPSPLPLMALWFIHPSAFIGHPFPSRACSSVESERLSSKQNVAGSSPARLTNLIAE